MLDYNQNAWAYTGYQPDLLHVFVQQGSRYYKPLQNSVIKSVNGHTKIITINCPIQK